MRGVCDVVCFSHLRWGFVYQRPNHLMSRWARERRVLFVEEPLFDAATPRVALREAAPNLWTLVPHLPAGMPPRHAERALRQLLDDGLEHVHVSSPLLWFYSPMALAFAGHLEAAVTVYDCMDELSAFHGAPPELSARERDLFARADVVFTGGHSLYEAKRRAHPFVHAFPSSVDAAHFAKARGSGSSEPRAQRDIPRPRIGFFGVVDERMDRDLLARMADAHPEWHVVLLGPVVKIDPDSLPRRPNLHYLGPSAYGDLPAFIGGWDVAMMPFAENEATRFISPTKTLEYLAAGKPVVSTPIRDIVRPYGERGLARIGASEGDGFVREVEAALAERGTPAAAARRAAADAWVATTSWDRTWDEMRRLVHVAAERRRRTA
jgi:UDP-galactopyranose mutase